MPDVGFGICAAGWLLLAVAPLGLGRGCVRAMLLLFGFGAVLVFINFLALRQAVTPAPLLGRMTSTMRWLILLPAGPGRAAGGWLGEHVGLRAVAGLRRPDGAAGRGDRLAAGADRDLRVLPRPTTTGLGSGSRPPCRLGDDCAGCVRPAGRRVRSTASVISPSMPSASRRSTSAGSSTV
jgi:hypothetical protein